MGSRCRSFPSRTVVRASLARQGRSDAIHVLAILRRPAHLFGTGIRAEPSRILHRAPLAAIPVLLARTRFHARGVVATGALGGPARPPGSREDPPGYQLYDA